MRQRLTGVEIQRVIDLIAKLPGFGPRSAKRATLHLLKRRDTLMGPLATALAEAQAKVKDCAICGNLDSLDPCTVCSDTSRQTDTICVVQDVGDLWALERAGSYRGQYHVLGGLLSALDGVGPDDLNISGLAPRVQSTGAQEVILALSTTVDGQTTAHYVSDRLEPLGIKVTRLAQGVPVGGELDHLDDGTLIAALSSRRGV